MIELLLWWRFLWRQKHGKSACTIRKGRLWYVADVIEAERLRRESMSDMWPEPKV